MQDKQATLDKIRAEHKEECRQEFYKVIRVNLQSNFKAASKGTLIVGSTTLIANILMHQYCEMMIMLFLI
jgi:hypothetical protein